MSKAAIGNCSEIENMCAFIEQATANNVRRRKKKKRSMKEMLLNKICWFASADTMELHVPEPSCI